MKARCINGCFEREIPQHLIEEMKRLYGAHVCTTCFAKVQLYEKVMVIENDRGKLNRDQVMDLLYDAHKTNDNISTIKYLETNCAYIMKKSDFKDYKTKGLEKPSLNDMIITFEWSLWMP